MIKTLPKKINETLEEGYKRKAKVLDDLYLEMNGSYTEDSNPMSEVIVDVIEIYNNASLKEDK